MAASVKNVMFKKKDHVWNPATCNCQNGKYLASIISDSTIMSDEIIEVPTNLNEKKKKKKNCKLQKIYILLAFLLITIALLIVASIYCYVVRFLAKQKHL